MSLKKKISIKPIHLMVGGAEKKRRTPNRKNKKMIQSLFKPNKVKKELLERIKKHQQNKRNEIEQKGGFENKEDFSNSFQDSLLYLDKVSTNIKNDRKSKTLKKEKPKSILKEPSYKPPPPPPYGILKGGSKQLYSEYRKTLKNRDNKQVDPNLKLKFNLEKNAQPEPIKPMFVTERQNKLSDLKLKFNPIPTQKPRPKRYKKTKTLKKRLILGKKNGKVSVLIKNRKTRRKIKNDTLKLKKKSLEEIKQYLRIHNLIKIGTDAPEDVIRETFENAFLSGNIYNKSSDNLIHNYVNVK